MPGDKEGIRNCCCGRRVMFWGFLGNLIILGYLGICPIGDPYLALGAFHTILHFLYFFVDWLAIRFVGVFH